MDPKVIKKDGSLEDFDQDKIARVVTAAGLKPQEGFDLANNVSTWIKGLGKEKITTFEIRAKVIEELSKVNKIVADLFVQYEATKDKGLNVGTVIDDI